MQALILTEPHKLLSCNVIGEKQYEARYKGFYGELDFLRTFADAKRSGRLISEATLRNGGYFLPTIDTTDNSLESSCYVTISSSKPGPHYLNIYQQLSRLSEKLYFIEYSNSTSITDWPLSDIMKNGVPCKTPELTVYHYDKNTGSFEISSIKNLTSLFDGMKFRERKQKVISDTTRSFYSEKLKSFDEEILLDLYVERFVFDGLIKFLHVKRSDIDAISIKPDGKIAFIEIKEKDKSKTPPEGFGMDEHRIEAINRLRLECGVDYNYIIREIADQESRELIAWRSISMDKFTAIVSKLPSIEGGHGMRSQNTSNPTRICPSGNFATIESFN